MVQEKVRFYSQLHALIETMKHQLMYGGAQLPVELSTMLEDFAAKEDMVTYDGSRGIVKFKSDLLFAPGSDTICSNSWAGSGVVTSEFVERLSAAPNMRNVKTSLVLRNAKDAAIVPMD